MQLKCNNDYQNILPAKTQISVSQSFWHCRPPKSLTSSADLPSSTNYLILWTPKAQLTAPFIPQSEQ
jgi:hypothetical protein